MARGGSSIDRADKVAYEALHIFDSDSDEKVCFGHPLENLLTNANRAYIHLLSLRFSVRTHALKGANLVFS